MVEFHHLLKENIISPVFIFQLYILFERKILYKIEKAINSSTTWYLKMI